MNNKHLHIRWLKNNLKKIKNDLWIDHSFEQQQEIMCGCYDQSSAADIKEDLKRRIEGDSDYIIAQKEYEEALNGL
tara:strand:+ start:231 stop:458 length:228 start_codon:yes stop_codon:yes gene_type:complete